MHDFLTSPSSEFGFPLTEIPIELPRLYPAALNFTRIAPLEEFTQTDVCERPVRSNLMLIGERLNEEENSSGCPFVEPVGKILDNALDEAGIDRAELYMTNAIKHTQYKNLSAPRPHEHPNRSEFAACHMWLEAEIRAVQPYVVVCLGEIAARSLFQEEVRIGELRGNFHATRLAARTYVTVHPSSLLQARDSKARERDYALFVSDLRRVARKVRELERRAG